MAWRDPKQAGARALVSPATIKRAALRGELRGFKVGGRLWRFTDADIDAWVESQRAPAPYIVPTTTKGVVVTQVQPVSEVCPTGHAGVTTHPDLTKGGARGARR
jgi:excisionase family DNA binding protein